MKTASIDYVAQAKKLSVEQQERLLSRMTGKLPKRIKKEKLTLEEAFAIQLELEDEQLQEWRANRTEIEEKANKLKLKAKEKLANSTIKSTETTKAAKSPLKATGKVVEKTTAKPTANKQVGIKAPVAKTATIKVPAVKVLTVKTPTKK